MIHQIILYTKKKTIFLSVPSFTVMVRNLSNDTSSLSDHKANNPTSQNLEQSSDDREEAKPKYWVKVFLCEAHIAN